MNRISSFGKTYEELNERITSVHIELDDILTELDNLQDQLLADPLELDRINQQLQHINNLFHKHGVNTIDELLAIKKDLESKVSNTESLDNTISEKENELFDLNKDLDQVALNIRNKRQAIIPILILRLSRIDCRAF